MVCCCSNFLPVIVQDSKIDAVKSEKLSAAAATPKQNGLDIVSITCDGCEIPFIALLYTF